MKFFGKCSKNPTPLDGDLVGATRAGVLFLEDPLTELVFGIGPRKHEFVAAFVFDHAEVRDVLAFILGALEIEEHQTLFSFDGVVDIVIHRNIIVEELVICVFSGGLWFPCFDRLHVALVVFWFDVLLADCASNKTTMMIVEADSGYHTLTSLTLGQGSAEGFLLTCGVLVSDKALVTFKETVAVLTISPLDDGAILRIAQLAEVSTGMVGDLVVTFLALVAILLTSEEGGDTGDDVVVVVVVVKVQIFVGVGTRIYHAFKCSLETTLSWYPGRTAWNFLISSIPQGQRETPAVSWSLWAS